MTIYNNGTQPSDSILSLQIPKALKLKHQASSLRNNLAQQSQQHYQNYTPYKSSTDESKSQDLGSPANASQKRQLSTEQEQTSHEPLNKRVSLDTALANLVLCSSPVAINSPLKRLLVNEDVSYTQTCKVQRLETKLTLPENTIIVPNTRCTQLRICYPGFCNPKEEEEEEEEEEEDDDDEEEEVLNNRLCTESYNDKVMTMNQYSYIRSNYIEIGYPNNDNRTVKFRTEQITVRTFEKDSIPNIINYKGSKAGSPSKSAIKPHMYRQYVSDGFDINDEKKLKTATKLNTNNNIILESGIAYTDKLTFEEIRDWILLEYSDLID